MHPGIIAVIVIFSLLGTFFLYWFCTAVYTSACLYWQFELKHRFRNRRRIATRAPTPDSDRDSEVDIHNARQEVASRAASLSGVTVIGTEEDC